MTLNLTPKCLANTISDQVPLTNKSRTFKSKYISFNFLVLLVCAGQKVQTSRNTGIGNTQEKPIQQFSWQFSDIYTDEFIRRIRMYKCQHSEQSDDDEDEDEESDDAQSEKSRKVSDNKQRQRSKLNSDQSKMAVVAKKKSKLEEKQNQEQVQKQQLKKTKVANVIRIRKQRKPFNQQENKLNDENKNTQLPDKSLGGYFKAKKQGKLSLSLPKDTHLQQFRFKTDAVIQSQRKIFQNVVNMKFEEIPKFGARKISTPFKTAFLSKSNQLIRAKFSSHPNILRFAHKGTELIKID